MWQILERNHTKMSNTKELIKLFEQKFVAHPWHGVTIGEDAPNEVKAYIEINPNDQIKYEIDTIR